MSRRYGRNQKRKHRLQIAQLAKDNRYLTSSKVSVERDLADLIEMLGRYSACLTPKKVSDINGDRVEVLKPIPFDVAMNMSPDMLYMPKRATMHALRVFIENNHERLEKMIHCVYTGKSDAGATYALSQEAFACMPVEQLASVIGRQIAYKLRQQQDRGSA